MLIILITYLVLFVSWLFLATIAVYDNLKYYDSGTKMKLGLNIFIWGSVVTLIISFFFIYNIDWTQPIKLGF